MPASMDFCTQAGRGPSNVESALHRHTTHVAAQPGMQSVLGGSDLADLMTLVRAAASLPT